MLRQKPLSVGLRFLLTSARRVADRFFCVCCLTGVLSLSVAFTKEDSAETASETQLPDRPISPEPNLVTAAGLEALHAQLEASRIAFEAANSIEDINERRRQSAVPLRDLRYFRERVSSAQLIAA